MVPRTNEIAVSALLEDRLPATTVRNMLSLLMKQSSRTRWFVRYIEPEALLMLKGLFPGYARGVEIARLVLGEDCHIGFSCGSRTKPWV